MIGMTNFDFHSEWESYAKNELGISSMQFAAWGKLQESIYGNVQAQAPQSSLTPYILEERKMNVTQMDIFSRMMHERILWLAGPVNDQMSTVACAQLMFLENLAPKEDIICYIDSPGGSVKSGLSIVDIMNYISPNISTINIGMAASMGSILLGSGTKGMRSALPNSRVMLHQVSHGVQGNIQETRISMAESEKYNDTLFNILGEATGKDPKKVMKDATRDLWLDAEKALKYGIIDEIITKKPE